MKNLVVIAALALSGLFTSCAVSAESAAVKNAANPAPPTLNKIPLYIMPAHVTNTTANYTTPTPAHVTNTTANYTTPAHVTNTTANYTTPAHVTNTTANYTTPAHVTNTTANYTTPAHVTNTTANYTTPTPAHVTNMTANYTTPAHVTNTTAANHSTTISPQTTVLPTLSPNFSLPVSGLYNISLKNTTCIKMAIGIQLIVDTKPQNLYFNIPPRKTRVSGKCGSVDSWINLQFNSGFVNFTFGKDENHYYISEISAALHAMNNLDKTYSGIMKNVKLFNTKLGHSYKCKSKQVVAFSTDNLQILMIDTQIQAFDISDGMFGKAEECFMDFKNVLPIVFGVVLVVLIIIIVVVYLICRRNQAAGYQRI
ncbi:lysosome-associated membrane glycoprotein 3 isoform X2 [Pristis pectinata]|uniref:lysosome-associated membrane glycoprotein 3 isoform X2 n=1 Tax=Pristis pectinata TaxID=685728 RepID=UPI00223DED6A|nr:lysosome-associated membrane glycoprotein 3 isoform X2 [Pristis pectinata]